MFGYSFYDASSNFFNIVIRQSQQLKGDAEEGQETLKIYINPSNFFVFYLCSKQVLYICFVFSLKLFCLLLLRIIRIIQQS